MVLIYTGADSSYAFQTAVWIASLSKSQTSNLEICIFGNGWTKSQKSLVDQFQSRKLSVEWIKVDQSNYGHINLSNKFPVATIYNILAPKFFLSGHKRALYMDADTIVGEDLTEFWDRPLLHTVGAVVDAHVSWMASPSMWRPWREEGIPALTPYLNTGILLIDINHWNEISLTERSVDFLQKYSLPCIDQDALNLVVRGNFDYLEPRFNSMPYHHLQMFRYVDTIESDSSIGAAIENPAIIHFHRSFLGKPWNFGCSHPGANIWRDLADEVDPNWHKRLSMPELGRSWVARSAGMTKMDVRSSRHPRTIKDFFVSSDCSE